MTDCVISSIEDVRYDGRAVRIMLDDTPRITSKAVVRELGLHEGAKIDVQLLDRTEARLAHERALRLVSARERSQADLRERLAHDGYPPDVVDSVCARFMELSLIDDERFATMLASSRSRSGYGPRKILEDLRRHGVDEAIARSAVADACPDPRSTLTELIERAAPRTRAQREQTLRRLVRRGFDTSSALSALESFSPRSDDCRSS